jgi:hypothetical protein
VFVYQNWSNTQSICSLISVSSSGERCRDRGPVLSPAPVTEPPSVLTHFKDTYSDHESHILASSCVQRNAVLVSCNFQKGDLYWTIHPFTRLSVKGALRENFRPWELSLDVFRTKKKTSHCPIGTRTAITSTTSANEYIPSYRKV